MNFGFRSMRKSITSLLNACRRGGFGGGRAFRACLAAATGGEAAHGKDTGRCHYRQDFLIDLFLVGLRTKESLMRSGTRPSTSGIRLVEADVMWTVVVSKHQRTVHTRKSITVCPVLAL
jgi:hypothetical protein